MEFEVTDAVKYFSRKFKSMKLNNDDPKKRDEVVDELIREYQQNKDNQREVFWHIISNLFFLIPSRLQKWSLRGPAFDDAVQNSILHIEKSLKHFDPDYGVKFSNYIISYHIIETAAKEILDQESTVYIPYVRRKKLMQQLKERNKEEDKDNKDGNLFLSIDDNNEHSVSTFLEELDYSKFSTKLDPPETIDQSLYFKEIKQALEKALSEHSTVLKKYERVAVIHTFGLFGAPTLKLDEIQGVFTSMGRMVSTQRICQIKTQAIQKLRGYLTNMGIDQVTAF